MKSATGVGNVFEVQNLMTWIAIVLGYLWLGVFIVLGVSYLVTNG